MESVEQKKHRHAVSGNAHWYNHYRKSLQVLQKFKVLQLSDLPNPGQKSKIVTTRLRYSCTPSFNSAWITISSVWKQFKGQLTKNGQGKVGMIL